MLAPAGSQTSFWGLITFPVKYLPYAFIAMDFLMGGPQAAAVSVSGAVVGHLWWWSVWETGLLGGWASAPRFLRSLMGEDRRRRNGGRGVDEEPPAGARATGVKNWGGGCRLGD